MYSAQNKKGFTLVELLVVISIISILATMGFVVYQQVFKNSRDAKRQSDLKQLQSALEQYRVDQGFYPPAINFATDVSLTNATGQSAVTVTRTYLKTIPHDPQSPDYSFTAYKSVGPPVVTCPSPSDCLDYCLWAQVENSANAKDTACPNDTTRTLEVTKP